MKALKAEDEHALQGLLSNRHFHHGDSELMAGHRRGQHPPIAWTASIAGSRRESMVSQTAGYLLQTQHCKEKKKKTWTSEVNRYYNNKDTTAA